MQTSPEQENRIRPDPTHTSHRICSRGSLMRLSPAVWGRDVRWVSTRMADCATGRAWATFRSVRGRVQVVRHPESGRPAVRPAPDHQSTSNLRACDEANAFCRWTCSALLVTVAARSRPSFAVRWDTRGARHMILSITAFGIRATPSPRAIARRATRLWSYARQ